MKITLLKENIFPKIQDASHFISNKPQLPILSGIFLSCRQSTFIIRSTDMKVGYQTMIGGKIEQEGECVVPARFLSETLASLKPGPVVLELQDNTLQISQGRVKAKLTTFSSQDFPPFPVISEEFCTLDTKAFLTAIEMTSYAASLDETRPVLASLLLAFEDSECTVVATDGYRLAVHPFAIPLVEKKRTVLIQAKMLSDVVRIIDKEKSKQTRFLVSSELVQAVFVAGDTTVLVRLTEGEFPPYQNIIPPSFTLIVPVDREDLIDGLKTCLVVAKESSSIVSLHIEPKTLTISGNSMNIGENEVGLDTAYAGEEKRTISVNAKFLLDAVSKMTTKFIEFHVNEELKPVMVKPEGENPFVYIVMPFKR
jgi:DNA polymerase III subunit beta